MKVLSGSYNNSVYNGILSISVLSVLYVVYSLFNLSYDITWVNIIIFLLSLVILLFTINSIRKKGVRQYSVFYLFFYSSLLLNNCQISELQFKKELIDIYYLFVGPLIFGSILFFFDQYKVKPWKKLLNLSPTSIGIILWIFVLILELYIINNVGLRILMPGKWLTENATEFVVPGISGIVYVISWILVMFIPDVNKFLKSLFLLNGLVIMGIISVSRGNIIRIVLTYIMIYAINKGNRILTRKVLLVIIATATVVLLGFSVLGELRESVRHNTNIQISDVLQSRINNKVINWYYCYTAINFDVLKAVSYDEVPNYSLSCLALPLLRLLGNDEVVKYLTSRQTYGLNGLNASTFLNDFIADWGLLYFIPIMMLGIFVGLCILLSKCAGTLGGYAFLMMISSISVMGNYYIVPNLCAAFLGGILIYVFLKPSAKVKEAMK